jgi:Ca-activated chloride channel family protein
MSRWFAFGMIVLALATFTAQSRGQNAGAPPSSRTTVVGSVVDDNLQPLAGVDVALLRSTRVVKRTTSGADGAFTFSDVAPGRYQIRASRTGLPTVERDLVVGAGVDAVRLPLVMAAGLDQQGASEDARKLGQGQGQGAAAGRVGGGGGGSLPASNGAPVAAPVAAPNEVAPTPPMRSVVGGISTSSAAITTAQAPPPPGTQAAGRSGGVGGGFDQWREIARERDATAVAGGEGYASVRENRFRRTVDEPLSTFGADVDTASFTNVRRFINNGQLPPVEAVRVEEFINYFKFDYAAPTGGHPIGITTEVGDAPWEPRHKLVLVGARAAAPSAREIAGRNIVLLVDVSGSMATADKLPLVKSGLGLFVDALRPDDRIAIVTYAGTSGVALPPTPARERARIRDVIAGLGAGGSTNGAGGIVTAYRLARQAYIPGGVNRVILATDGDFNVGVTSHEGLLRLIEREKESGVFLSVLGVGTGNLQDATMELLADKGNGHYAYLDSLQEARRVLVREADATMETVAKDVKFQVEFNPAEVAAWKLIGYENRLLAHQDFNDDRKDGGEMGAGHSVTVLYEIVPVGAERGRDDDDGDLARPVVDPLRYQTSAPVVRPAASAQAKNGEWLTVKVRYQEPEGNRSRLISVPVRAAATRQVHLPFASAVAEFGMLLRESRPELERWEALMRRFERMNVSGARAADREAVSELVALAASMKK